MDPFQFLGRYVWAIAVAFSLLNYVIVGRRLAATEHVDAEARENAQSCLRNSVLASSTPWLVMGWGELVGGVPDVWHYLRPSGRNPYELAWLGTVFLLSLVYAVWVFAVDGANKMSDFRRVSAMTSPRTKQMSPEMIKFTAVISPLFILLWLYFLGVIKAPFAP